MPGVDMTSAAARTVLLALAVGTAGCSLGTGAAQHDPASWLPTTVAGEPITYRTGTIEERGNPLLFEADAFESVGVESSEVTLTDGHGPSGFTVYAFQASGVKGGDMLEPLIDHGKLEPVSRHEESIGGHSVTVLELQPSAADDAYLLAVGDTLVLVLADSPEEAEELIGGIPASR
jgi:hypothetical protein